MAYKMKGSPAKMGTIQGTAGHRSALKHVHPKHSDEDNATPHTHSKKHSKDEFGVPKGTPEKVGKLIPNPVGGKSKNKEIPAEAKEEFKGSKLKTTKRAGSPVKDTKSSIEEDMMHQIKTRHDENNKHVGSLPKEPEVITDKKADKKTVDPDKTDKQEKEDKTPTPKYTPDSDTIKKKKIFKGGSVGPSKKVYKDKGS